MRPRSPLRAAGTLDSGALVTRARSFDPWSTEHLTRLLAANAVGLAVIGTGAYQAAGGGVVRTQLTWLELSVIGLLVAGTANALWLLRGRQAVTLARVEVLSTRQRALLFPRLATATSAAPGALVWVPGTTRAHRAGCSLVAGKPTRLAADREGLVPCEVCEP
jgi:hypothetical protein